MRVLVLRPKRQGLASAARLIRLGHDVLAAPILIIEGLDGVPPPGCFAAVVVTSSNALPSLAAQAPRFTDCPAFAVGPRVSAGLAAIGFRDVTMAADAASLGALIAGRLTPSPLLLVAGRQRKREPEVTLREAGFRVAVWETYEARIAATLPPEIRNALVESRLDAVLHYSRRSAAAALDLAAAAGLGDAFAMLRHACLSADVASGLVPLAGARIEVAEQPEEDALFRVLARPDATGAIRARAPHALDANDGTIPPACACRTANG